MARIPMGNFGAVVAPAAPRDRQMPVGAFVTDGGLDQVAHRLDVAAREEAAREEAERKEANRVAALTAQATAKNRLADLHDELVTGLNDGTLQKTELQQVHSERAGKVLEESIKGVAPEHQALVRAQLEDDLGRSSRDIRRAVADRNRQDIGAGIVGYIEEMQRYAGRGERSARRPCRTSKPSCNRPGRRLA